MNKEHIKGLGDFEFYEGYIIGRNSEGVHCTSNSVDVVSDLIFRYLHGRPVVYISDRLNSCSIDPLTTTELIVRNNIKFAGVVIYTHQQQNVYSYEEEAIKGTTMRSFDSLDAAVAWAKQKVLELS
jgi:hypothetical protein